MQRPEAVRQLLASRCCVLVNYRAEQGLCFAAQGFSIAHGFFIPQGLCFIPHEFFIPQGLCFIPHEFFIPQGLALALFANSG